jgi:hypothetical protein
MFCTPGLVFCATEGVGSHFHVLSARNSFRLYRGSHILFSCFARPDSVSAVPRASGPVFKFCGPRIVFGGTEVVGSHFHVLRARTHFGGSEGVGSHFHVLRARTHFLRYRGRVPFLCFARPESFSALPWESCTVFMFCALGLVFGGTDGVSSLFHVLRARTHFGRYRGRRVPFSPRLIFGGTEGLGNPFLV